MHGYDAARVIDADARVFVTLEARDPTLIDLVHPATSAPRLVRLSRLQERLADVASGRLGSSYSLLADGDGLIAKGRRPWGFDDQRLLMLRARQEITARLGGWVFGEMV
jgi:hypothetical protein